MKYTILKGFIMGAGLMLSVSAFAADVIVARWKLSEEGKPKLTINISKAGSSYQAVVSEGFSAFARSRVGKTLISNIRFQGNGKYAATLHHPVLPRTYPANISITGNTMTITSTLGTYVGVRQ